MIGSTDGFEGKEHRLVSRFPIFVLKTVSTSIGRVLPLPPAIQISVLKISKQGQLSKMKISRPLMSFMIAFLAEAVAQQEKIIVTGATTGVNEKGAAPARLNILDLYEESGPTW